jgi:hypothetical protein
MLSFSVLTLSGAKANEYAKWPDGFDPKAAGVIFD